MLGWLVRIIMLAAGVVAGWFVPRDDVGYAVIQVVVVLALMLALAVAALYLPRLKARMKSEDRH